MGTSLHCCKDCLIRHNWIVCDSEPDGIGDCDLCWDRGLQLYRTTGQKVEAPVIPQTVVFEGAHAFEALGNRIDEDEQLHYQRLCNSLFWFYRRGPKAGTIDEDGTKNFLGAINVVVNGLQDWKATYKRRQRAKQSRLLVEERDQ